MNAASSNFRKFYNELPEYIAETCSGFAMPGRSVNFLLNVSRFPCLPITCTNRKTPAVWPDFKSTTWYGFFHILFYGVSCLPLARWQHFRLAALQLEAQRLRWGISGGNMRKDDWRVDKMVIDVNDRVLMVQSTHKICSQTKITRTSLSSVCRLERLECTLIVCGIHFLILGFEVLSVIVIIQDWTRTVVLQLCQLIHLWAGHCMYRGFAGLSSMYIANRICLESTEWCPWSCELNIAVCR